MPQDEYNCLSLYKGDLSYSEVQDDTQTDHLRAPLMRWYAINMTYQAVVSTCGTLAYSSPLSLRLFGSHALCV